MVGIAVAESLRYPRRMMRLLRLMSLLVVVACNNDSKLNRVSHTDTFYQELSNQVDILWVIDNSVSMGDEQEELANRFGEFITAMGSVGLEWQIAIVTTDMETSGESGRIQGGPLILTPETENYENKFKRIATEVGLEGSDKEAGIDAAIQALSEPLISTDNAGFVRDEAKLSIIYLSDENDCTNRGAMAGMDGEACYSHPDLLVPVADLITEYTALKSDPNMLKVSAIVGPDVSEGCAGAVPGFRYRTMAEAFGGLTASICEEDFTEIMTELGLQSAGLYTSFRLTYAAVLGTIEVYVDDVSIAESETDGWTYDETYQILYFNGASVPDYGTTITVEYEVAGARTEDSGGA